jgi:hypothetical protein
MAGYPQRENISTKEKNNSSIYSDDWSKHFDKTPLYFGIINQRVTRVKNAI